MNPNLLNSKNVIWIVVLAQNIFVSIEALFFALLTFSSWSKVSFFSTMHFLWLAFTLAFAINAAIGFLIKDKPALILTYAITNAACHFLFFFFMYALFYDSKVRDFIILNMSVSSQAFLEAISRYLLMHINGFRLWFWIQLPLMICGTILVIYYRILIIREKNNTIAINIDAMSPLYQETPLVVPQQYYPGDPLYQKAQVTNQYAQQEYTPNAEPGVDLNPQPSVQPSAS